MLEENSQAKFSTRSTARHLRRKRLHDARKAEKQQEYLTNVVNVNSGQESATEKLSDQPTVLTKSKARRLRKKDKAGLLENYCSFCDSYVYVPVFETTVKPEVIEEDTEESRALTKSKARRLRKKNKSKLVQNICSLCYNVHFSNVDPNIVEFIKTTEYRTKIDRYTASNKQNCDSEKIIDAQVCPLEYDKKAEQSDTIPESIKSPENCKELACLSRSVSFGDDVQVRLEQWVKSTEDSGIASGLDQKIEDRLQSKIHFIREDAEEISKLIHSFGQQKLGKLLKSDRNPEVCNEKCDERNSEVISANIELEESITPSIDRNSKKEEPFSVAGEPRQESVEISTVDDKNKISANIAEECTQTANPIEEESKVQLVLNSNPGEVEVSSVESIKTSSNSINFSENIESGKLVLQSLKSSVSTIMSDSKVTIPEKTREEIKAEREAKKAAKALAKSKSKTAKVQDKDTTNNNSVAPDSTKKKQKNETIQKQTVKAIIQVQSDDAVLNKTVNDISVKDVPSEASNEGKSKAELRAARRAKQEAQRAAKQQLSSEKSKVKGKESDDNTRLVQPPTETNAVNKTVTPKKSAQKGNAHEINLFKHLYHEREQAIVDIPFVNSHIHPAIVRLGTQYASKVIVGSNARCVALLVAVKQLIQDFERPSQADFIRGLEASLQESVAYLHYCRPIAVSMQNALRHLKWQMTQLPSALSDIDAKAKLSSAIDTYILEQIQLADKAISITIQTKISNGDVILTYGYSSLINKILLDAHTAGTQFRVIIVDGRPWLEGREQLRRLAKHGIECSYILINALSYVMPEVSKVFLGAHAILANGAVMSRVGTAQVALIARAFNIPVLVACETHKSCERVQTDSIVYNELGNADELVEKWGGPGVEKSLLANWRTRKSLNLLNITYDVTPADLVTAVVTELAILPCTSVPVILRIKPSEI